MNATDKRFQEFRRLLLQATGDKAIFYHYRGANSVRIERNEFSPAQDFPSLQAALDHFAYLLPAEFVNP